MKFRCDKTLLTDAVTNISRIIPSKSSFPALEGVQIKAYSNEIKLTGYDNEVGITTSLENAVEEDGEIVLPAKLFSDMIRRMPGQEITIETGEKYLTQIKSGMSEFTILGIPSEEYPELPRIEEGSGISLQESVLKSMIEQTIFAVAVADSKPIHTGSLFDISADTLTVVSVDGYRLAMRSEKISGGSDISFVVPGKALNEISKLIKDDSDKTLSINVSRRHIVFNVGRYEIISRLLEGEFLDYKASIPQGAMANVKVSRREFIESIERVSLLISDRVRSPLRILFDEERIAINCSTSLGKSYDEVSCNLNGDPLEMGFNNKFLLDALKAAGCDEVLIEINGKLSPIKLLPPDGDSFLFLVLPVRLKNEG